MKSSLSSPPKWAKDAIATTAGWCNKKTGEIYVCCRILENPIDHAQFIKNIKAGKPVVPVEEVKKVEEVEKKLVRKPAAKKLADKKPTRKPAVKK